MKYDKYVIFKYNLIITDLVEISKIIIRGSCKKIYNDPRRNSNYKSSLQRRKKL